jgi:hypothetical protein
MIPSQKKAVLKPKKPPMELPKQVEAKTVAKKQTLKKNKSITRQQLERPVTQGSPTDTRDLPR